MGEALHLRWEGGDYRSLLERELDIHGIPTAVVDPHHHVLPFWAHHLEGRQPAHLLHIDAHDDMFTDDKHTDLRARETIVVYTRKNLQIMNFIWAADYFGLLTSIHHFDPRKKSVDCFKDDIRGTKVFAYAGTKGHGWLYGINTRNTPVERSLCVRISREEVQRRLNADENPLILDLDLDAFQSLMPQSESELPERTYRRRLEKTLEFLSGVRRPSMITLARSLHPTMYTPIGRVFVIENDVIEGLKRIYAVQEASSTPGPLVYPCASNGQLSLPL